VRKTALSFKLLNAAHTHSRLTNRSRVYKFAETTFYDDRCPSIYRKITFSLQSITGSWSETIGTSEFTLPREPLSLKGPATISPPHRGEISRSFRVTIARARRIRGGLVNVAHLLRRGRRFELHPRYITAPHITKFSESLTAHRLVIVRAAPASRLVPDGQRCVVSRRVPRFVELSRETVFSLDVTRHDATWACETNRERTASLQTFPRWR